MKSGTPSSVKITEIATGAFVTLCKIKPSGALQARRQSSGAISLYWRYSLGTTSQRVSVGLYDPLAPPKSLDPTARGYSVAAAVRAAETLSIPHSNNKPSGGYPALIEAQASANKAARQAKEDAETLTLKKLLTDYCDHLKALERGSHKDARSIFNLHVVEAWPKVAALPASAVTGEQIADMMRRVIEAGKGRTANKLRSYLRAAYQTAKAAKSKPSIPVHFKAYQISINPAADTEPDESQNRADKKPLTAQELRTYWKTIHDLPEFKGAVLRLHLLTGGQRIEQLVNLLTADIGESSITIFDGKGRPGKPPRPHVVPLTKTAAKALAGCKPKGVFALSTDDGKTHLAATTLSAWAIEAAGKTIEGFQAKRIRSGVETLLASAGVSSEIRGRLQSHGISGVQARHYDGHDYMAEKLKALQMLERLLAEPAASNVTSIRKKRA